MPEATSSIVRSERIDAAIYRCSKEVAAEKLVRALSLLSDEGSHQQWSQEAFRTLGLPRRSRMADSAEAPSFPLVREPNVARAESERMSASTFQTTRPHEARYVAAPEAQLEPEVVSANLIQIGPLDV